MNEPIWLFSPFIIGTKSLSFNNCSKTQLASVKQIGAKSLDVLIIIWYWDD
ncbi:MAG TPA: hypothetical protein VD908_14760 [Cytophagales bacterium]|nr:hypothetical protein [Cytophagales bacterium]